MELFIKVHSKSDLHGTLVCRELFIVSSNNGNEINSAIIEGMKLVVDSKCIKLFIM